MAKVVSSSIGSEIAALLKSKGQDVRQMAPVGVIKPTIEVVNTTGYAAQGHALAMSVMNACRSAARDFRMILERAWDYDVQAREACIKEINKQVRAARAAVDENANLSALEKREKAKLAASATTRGSQFATALKAMNAGMTVDTLARALGIDREDCINVSFDTIVVWARKYLAGEGKGSQRGRKPDPWEVKLRNWLDRNVPDKADTKRFGFYAHLREEMSKELPIQEKTEA